MKAVSLIGYDTMNVKLIIDGEKTSLGSIPSTLVVQVT